MESIHPLRNFRETQNPRLTQDQLANLLGVSKASVSRWETGTRKLDEDLLSSVSAKTGIPKAKLRPDLAELLSETAQ
jgi:transcriptional regulator with XRE-family HTH domain